MQRVGVIGLGKMGLPIARNLMDRGFEVIGYRRHGSPELVEAGGKLADSAAEVASQSDVLLSIVPDTAAVSDIVCGEAGTLTTLRPGAVHIEMSTIDVGRKSAIRDAVQRSGGDMLDCPISGSPAMVAPRLATTFVSGEEASVAKVRPVLDAISGPGSTRARSAPGHGSSTSRTCCWPCTPWPRPRRWNWPAAAAWIWTSCSAPWTTRSAARRSGGSAAR